VPSDVAVAPRGAEDARAGEIVGPDRRVGLAIGFADGGREGGGRGVLIFD
jgi:hypothetical protein